MPSRVSRMKQQGTGCFECWLKEEFCFSGTLRGNCIACGSSQPKNTPFNGFFNEDLGALMYSLAQESKCIALGFGNSWYHILELNITTSGDLPETHMIPIHGEFWPSNKHLTYHIDQMVWLHYIPNVRGKEATTNFITSALFGRGYLAFLFCSDVIEETSHHGVEDEVSSTMNVRLQLYNFILFRLHESISEVMTAARKEKNDADKAYWSDVSAATSILLASLWDASKGLEDGSLQPLCGDSKLVDCLSERIKATLEHLKLLLHRRGLTCDPVWAASLDTPFVALRSNMRISAMTLKILRVEKQENMMSQRSSSTTSSTSASLDASRTPLSSIDQPSFQCVNDSNADTAFWLDTGPTYLRDTSVSRSGSPTESHSQTADLFDDMFPNKDIKGQSSPYSNSSSLPSGNIANESHETTRQITSRKSITTYSNTWNSGGTDSISSFLPFRNMTTESRGTTWPIFGSSVPFYSNTWNSGTMQKTIRGANPGPTPTFTCNNHLRPPARSQGASLLAPMPSYVSMTGASYYPAETTGEMASQVSEPPGSFSWPTTWSEQSNDTWRQS